MLTKYEKLKNNLSFAEDFTDFSESAYICDAVAEIADSNTSIYYSDIMDFIRSNPYALADAVDDGLYDPSHNYDLYRHGQAAEYMTIEREIYDDLDNYVLFAALDYAKNTGAPQIIP